MLLHTIKTQTETTPAEAIFPHGRQGVGIQLSLPDHGEMVDQNPHSLHGRYNALPIARLGGAQV